MCRLFGCVAREPISVKHDLLEAENPLIHQAEEHDSGWGMAVYKKADGEGPRCMRFPEAAHEHEEFVEATGLTGRMFNVHVRRATVGGLSPENTHPFCLGPYAFCHNGTIIRPHKLRGPDVRDPVGQTDSEVFFNFLIRDFDPEHARRSLRKDIRSIIERTPFSGLNFLLTDGETLYAYKLGIFDLYWAARPGSLVVASEKLTDTDKWHKVQDDVLLTLSPGDLDQPHAEHLVGERWVEKADIQPLDGGKGLRGEERGNFAAERAANLAPETT